MMSTRRQRNECSAEGVKFTETVMEEDKGPIIEKGIENPEGAYNCFLNVVIQSLW